MGRKKKLQASYTIELTELDRKLAHKGLNDLERPNVWHHAWRHYKETGTFLTIDDHVFVEGECDDILAMNIDKKEYPRLKAFVQWLQRNCPSAPRYGDSPSFGFRGFRQCQVVRLPGGMWITNVERLGWVTIDLRAGGWNNKPEQVNKGGRIVLDTNYRVLSEKDDRATRLLQIIDEFPAAWKIARNIYRNDLRATGELVARMNRDQKEQAVLWTQTRMEVATHAAALKDGLDEVMHHLENGTIVGTHFAEVDKLIEVYNRYTKGVRQNYKHMMRRKKKRRDE